jgi:hypothetical protein
MLNFRKLKTLLLMALIWLVLGFGKEASASDIILNDIKANRRSFFSGQPGVLIAAWN